MPHRATRRTLHSIAAQAAGGWWEVSGANNMEYVVTPSANQAYAGDTTTNGAWTVAVRGQETTGYRAFAFAIDKYTNLGRFQTAWNGAIFADSAYDVSLMDTSDHVYMWIWDGTYIYCYRDNSQVGVEESGYSIPEISSSWKWNAVQVGTWTLFYGAVYDSALDATQRTQLYDQMAALT